MAERARKAVRNKSAKKAKRPKRKTPQFLRARNENRLGMAAAMLAILIMTCVVGINSITLVQKEKAYAAREQELLQQISAEEARTKELEEFAR